MTVKCNEFKPRYPDDLELTPFEFCHWLSGYLAINDDAISPLIVKRLKHVTGIRHFGEVTRDEVLASFTE